MDKKLHNLALETVDHCIKAVLPEESVLRALKKISFSNKVAIVAIGKAAYRMTEVATGVLKEKVTKGIAITKYGHSKSKKIGNVAVYEAGHPILDENSIKATDKAIELVKGLSGDEELLFLVSGGGSALFESPKCSLEELQSITGQLLSEGASIQEINCIRKRLSNVKAGRFASLTKAKIYQIVLSDVLGDDLSTIASGPCASDPYTIEDAKKIIEDYNLDMSEDCYKLFEEETPKKITNVETIITGSVTELCKACKSLLESKGFECFVLTDLLSCEAREAGSFLASILKTKAKNIRKPTAFILGGETVVHLKGKGKGGRNQELSLSGGINIDGLKNACIFSFGSDGTDGPCDAAGGYMDWTSLEDCKEKKLDALSYLYNNDSYNLLKEIDGLIMTGPTGTNVNDLTVGVIEP